MHNRVGVKFQGQIETVLKECSPKMDIKVKKDIPKAS